MNSFIAIYNQSGIACASDTDCSIFRLSKEEPVAIAICPYSPIPWESIITQYLRKGEPAHHKTLEEYARDFEVFLQQFPANKAWNELGIDELNLIFLGYGKDDIYPSVCDIQIFVDEETETMTIGDHHTTQIDFKDSSAFCWNGNWDRLAPVLHGSTKHVMDYAIEKQFEGFETYKQRLVEKFKGTKYEEYVNKSLEEFDSTEVIPYENVVSAYDRILQDVKIGIDSFSMEDMVSSAESLVNANVRLNHLKNGGKGLVGHTREIAVITRTEGFTWVKHSLFAI